MNQKQLENYYENPNLRSKAIYKLMTPRGVIKETFIITKIEVTIFAYEKLPGCIILHCLDSNNDLLEIASYATQLSIPSKNSLITAQLPVYTYERDGQKIRRAIADCSESFMNIYANSDAEAVQEIPSRVVSATTVADVVAAYEKSLTSATAIREDSHSQNGEIQRNLDSLDTHRLNMITQIHDKIDEIFNHSNIVEKDFLSFLSNITKFQGILEKRNLEPISDNSFPKPLETSLLNDSIPSQAPDLNLNSTPKPDSNSNLNSPPIHPLNESDLPF